ncbi:MAG: hypothetical protein KatS3mg105_5103 [Gemmatales bacterium]|nr:MAG: hypothetical protein KatS3mg105_5103 [Gemmatales bacterium]
MVSRIHELVRKYPRYGYRMIAAKLRQEGWSVNFKTGAIVCGVVKASKYRKRCGRGGVWATAATACVRRRAEHEDHVWAWDFHPGPHGQRSSAEVVGDHRRVHARVLWRWRSIAASQPIGCWMC